MTGPMPGRFAMAVVAAAASVAAAPAGAEDIPIEIGWRGALPTAIAQTVPGGITQLDYDPQARIFRGTLNITGDAPQRRTLVVSYPGYNHRIDLRTHRFLPVIAFTIDHQPHASCTQNRVRAASIRPDNLPDALARNVAAGQLLSIASPNDCDDDLRLQATEARYNHNVRMNQYSGGFFLISPEIREAYRQAARHHGRSVDAILAEYDRQEARLEAVQLATARARAQGDRDFALAAEISQTMEMRIRSDEAIRELYRQEGVIEPNLVRDTAYLEALAARPE